ncbi:hypothetical protein [Bacillus pseudomycoides]|uniref:hypothetical protein n=1 Tax=Bacillus pseudomycoides TaxID=64104 RepID=UPI000BF876FA|nr:hypothetical protein [Bacillus pseudomycoides]PFW93884.1 hypothetical protein COL29_12135 [Bacillus pseudomycoides]
MKKFAINRLHQNEHEAILIFHATPSLSNYIWQWYLTDNKYKEGNPIEGQHYESWTTATDIIKEKGYDGLYLYCKYTDINTKVESKSEYIKLYSDFNKIIESGTIFDRISKFDENGAIIN